ncbi:MULTISPECIES: GNAT family N-acetyltransferase [unclassified Oceanispirochaeta]|uniref:GNAT family N-acetyltransferase n=1 Tax=unclassified Oceanispirochaeta TaxID=2635722 RepID=UPI000E09690C|nr:MULTISPECIES: GNAT family N-acetyltransferase [unclassified Oceanispirochaeta]MBF9017983.1 GNAT family N-acetyltransferase [Oceanispirochaeta sp. M2]NPD74494.1 GNAT family N-acetyltransferase [Oceanispirochaeta sp. M1]RDG29703.1 N-acetyltransferase [Oceanispirochaeta sp. M1]
MENLEIRNYVFSDCDGVNELIRGIQRIEFGFTETEFPQPELNNIDEFYRASDGNFWVAYLEDTLVGTSALLNLGGGIAKLGKMFVHPEYRGKPRRIAQNLLDTAFDWAKSMNFAFICFETTPEPCAAHSFYRRNSFIEVESSDFPPEYKLCPYPSRYFMKKLESRR